MTVVKVTMTMMLTVMLVAEATLVGCHHWLHELISLKCHLLVHIYMYINYAF